MPTWPQVLEGRWDIDHSPVDPPSGAANPSTTEVATKDGYGKPAPSVFLALASLARIAALKRAVKQLEDLLFTIGIVALIGIAITLQIRFPPNRVVVVEATAPICIIDAIVPAV